MKSPREHHPYGNFIPKHAQAMIIGSFPIGKFTNPKRRHEIKDHELDFFFGGERNLLWKLLGDCFGVDLTSKKKVIKLLSTQGLAIGDLIKSCRRHKGSASDANLYDIEWNKDLFGIIQKHGIKRVYFTSKQVQKWFHRLYPETGDDLQEVLLISPSAQSVRSVVKMTGFNEWRVSHPAAPVSYFITQSYRKIFRLNLS